MTNGQRTIATLLAVVAALLAVNIVVQTARPAKAATAAAGAGGTCPSDINGDAAVNVLDLVDLLLDFGTECPGPQVVDVAVVSSPNGHEAIVRIWSDGFAEYKVTVRDPDWEPQVWTPLPVNPDAPGSRPIAADGGDPDLDGPAGGSIVSRLWADGTVDSILFSENLGVVTVPQGWITEPN